MTGRDGITAHRPAPRPAARDDGPVRPAGAGHAGADDGRRRRPVEIRGATGRGRCPGDPGDPRGPRQRRPGRRHRRRRAVPPPPDAVRGAGPGRGARTTRSSASGRRSTPAGRSTSPTCSSGRTGSARASAGRCSRPSFGGAARRTTFASDDPRGPADLRPGRDARRCGPACTSRARRTGCRRRRRRSRRATRPPTSWRRPSGRGRGHDRTADLGSLDGADRRRQLRRPRWRRRSSRSVAPASGSTARSAS